MNFIDPHRFQTTGSKPILLQFLTTREVHYPNDYSPLFNSEIAAEPAVFYDLEANLECCAFGDHW